MGVGREEERNVSSHPGGPLSTPAWHFNYILGPSNNPIMGRYFLHFANEEAGVQKQDVTQVR